MERSDSRKIESTKAPELQQILGILHKWGIHTLGQLAALDKEELRARLGPEAVRLWERANGTATRLLKFIQHQTFHSGATLHLDRSRANSHRSGALSRHRQRLYETGAELKRC